MVSIDFWDTLVDAQTEGEKRSAARSAALRKLALKHEKELSQSMLDGAFTVVNRHFVNIWYNQHRTQTTNELAEAMLRELKIPATENEIMELSETFSQSLYHGLPPLAPGVTEALEQISSYYKLAIVSDTMFSPGVVLRDYLKQTGLMNFFEAYAFSDEIGASKPHRKGFEKVLKATGSRPAGSWHIGDNQKTDIAGAKNMGMKAILFTGFSEKSKNGHTADYLCSKWENVADILVSEIDG